MEIISHPENFCLSGNPMIWKIHVPEFINTGFCLQAWVTLKDKGKNEDLPVMMLHPDEQGNAEVDIRHFLHHRMQTELPDDFTGGVYPVKGNRIQYQMCFQASWDTNETYLESDFYVAFHGRFPLDAEMSFEDYVVLGQNYLSFVPQVIDTIPGAVHYLYFLNTGETGEFRVKVRAHYKGGAERVIITGRFQANRYDVYGIPAGLYHYGFLREWGRLTDYSVWVENNREETVGKQIRFTICRSELPARLLMFENSLGGLDSVLAYKQKDVLKIERDEFVQGARVKSVVTGMENTVECSSGYITKGMTELFRELARSERVFLCDGGHVREIVILKGSFTIDETDDLYSIDFKYKTSYTNGVFHDYVAPVFRLETGVVGSRTECPVKVNECLVKANKTKKLKL